MNNTQKAVWALRIGVAGARQTGLDKLVFKFWRKQPEHRVNASGLGWNIGPAGCARCFIQTAQASFAVGGVLGLLDGSCAPDCWSADLGFCRTVCKLGRASSFVLFVEQPT